MVSIKNIFVVFVQSLSCVKLFATPWTVTCQASLSFTSSWSFLKFMSIESVMPSNHLILCCPLLLLDSISPHQFRFGFSTKYVSGNNPLISSLFGFQKRKQGSVRFSDTLQSEITFHIYCYHGVPLFSMCLLILIQLKDGLGTVQMLVDGVGYLLPALMSYLQKSKWPRLSYQREFLLCNET